MAETHISVILDRSGSMEVIRDDTIGGFNNFLEEQKKLPDKATLTLVQFDSQDPHEVVCHFKALAEVRALTAATFVPRAATPLLDALGRGINDLESSIAKLPEKKRPGKVMMVVITDGQENSSREFSKKQVEKMIKDRSEKDDWQFVFLSSDMSAVSDAHGLGFAAGSTRMFAKNVAGVKDAWSSLAIASSRYRSGASKKADFSDIPDEPEP